MNEFLAVCLLRAPKETLGANNERMEHIVAILGEVCTKKQATDETLDKLSIVITNLAQDPQFEQICLSKLGEQGKTRISDTQARCNEEVRSRVQASLQ